MRRIKSIVGDIRPALWLNGATGAEVNTGVSAFDCQTPFTFMAWVYPDFAGSDGTGRTIIAKREAENSGNAFASLERTASQMAFRFSMRASDDSTYVDVASNAGTIRPFAWNHIAVVYNFANIWMYQNGTLARSVASDTDTGTPLNGNWRLGRNPRGGGLERNWLGGLSDVAVFSAALSASQIKEYMDRGLTGAEANLVDYWPLNEGAGGLAYNKSRQSRQAGAVSGGRWASRTMR